MKHSLTVVAALALMGAFGVAQAADASCVDQAAAKKLAGAAKNSFVKKCEKTSAASSAQSACDLKAADKKLAGAAKNSFVKKCVTDSAGAAAK